MTPNLPYASPIITIDKDMSSYDLGLVGLQNKLLIDGVTNCTSNIDSATSFFDAVLATSSLDASIFTSSNALGNSSSRVFGAVAAQIARKYLMQPVQSTSAATLILEQQRLVLSTPTFALTVVILISLSCISALLYFVASRMVVVSRNTGSILGLATVLSASPAFVDSLKTSRVETNEQLAERMAPIAFHTVVTVDSKRSSSSFVVEAATPVESLDLAPSFEASVGGQWWHPFSASWTIYAFVFFLPLVLVAVLEGTYQYSKSHQGIVSLSNVRSTGYAWSYIPALVILALRLCFESLIFAASLFQPFSLVRKGTARTQDLFRNPVGSASLVNIWTALQDRQFALLAISIVSVLAPALSIAVAGLFSPKPFQKTTMGFVHPADTFDLASPPTISTLHLTGASGRLSGVDVGNAASLYSMGLLENVSTSYPSWMWDNLAFPKLEIDTAGAIQNASAIESLMVTLPAIRANMNCSAIQNATARTFNGSFNSAGDSVDAGIAVTIPAPGGCSPLACPYGLQPESNTLCVVDNFTNQWIYALNLYLTEDTVFGQWANPANGLGLYLNKTTPYGCGTSLAWFGNMKNSEVQNITVLQCAPYLETVDVAVDLLMPDFKISPSNPPRPFEDSAKPTGGYLPSSDDGSDDAWSSLTASDDGVQVSFGNGHSYDEFFGQIVLNTHMGETDPSELLGLANVDNLREKMNKLYGLWIANELNFMSRVDLPAAASQPVRHAIKRDETITRVETTLVRTVYVNSTASPTSYVSVPTAQPLVPQSSRSFGANFTLTETRLVQSSVSTRVLEGLLAVTWLLSVITMLSVKTRKVLPRNPCSIAGMASLLVGSDMLTLIPRRSEWADDKTLLKHGLFEGYFFGLGWWGDGKTRRWGIDVGRAGLDGG